MDSLKSVRDQMREEWNGRAREDANYYVAFGRRDQEHEEFLSTAADVIRDLEGEIKRFVPPARQSQRTALEIGCGPGRLMRPLSRHFSSIDGIDVSDEMVARARASLADVPHAQAHHASGSDLGQFKDSSIDFVYSYAVFQHIPSAEVVFSYFREIVRVLKPGGYARLQINGLPKTSKTYTTWSGVRIGGDEIREFTRGSSMRLLSLTGLETQYMWTTWQKPPDPSEPLPAAPCSIRHVVNAFSGERAVPSNGRLACATLQMAHLPAACDLNSLDITIADLPGRCCYVGHPVNGLSQVNVFLPERIRTGLVPVHARWNGAKLCEDATIRVIPAGPAVPRLVAISDGVNLLSAQRIESGTIKVSLEEISTLEDFRATLDGHPVREVDAMRTDPLSSRYEVNFRLPPGTARGGHVLDLALGRRDLLQIGIEVV